MKPLRDLQKFLRQVKGPVFAIVALVAIGAAVGGWVLLPVRAQQPQAIPIQVNGETVLLEPGKNVHPQTYDLLIRDPGFASDKSIKWVYLDKMWVPLARAAFEQPTRPPVKERRPSQGASGQGIVGPDYIPECDINLSVPAYSQRDSAWASARLCNNGSCATMYDEGCAMTSTAMVFRYFGANTDPGQLNTCSANNGCCSSCNLVGDCAASNCSGGRATYVGYYAFNWLDMCGLLSQNRPPIVHVGNHYVVVYRSLGYDLYSGSDYYINDPIDGSTYKRLSYYPAPTETAEYRAN